MFAPNPYPERDPRWRGPALMDVDAAVRNAQRDEMYRDARHWSPNYESSYQVGSSADAPTSDRLECSPSMSSNAPFYVPRSPPAVSPRPQYHHRGSDVRAGFNMNPAREYEYRGPVQYYGYQPPLAPEPLYIAAPMPIYDSPTRWSDRLPSPERPPPQYMPGPSFRERERAGPTPPRDASRQPPPAQRSYSQARHRRNVPSSRRNPYPPPSHGRFSGAARYGGGKRRGNNQGNRNSSGRRSSGS
ncbi:hypothetical protein LZ554_008319 [Drepanopeziza brunnea f. sp. 'monogermtubi']|nr:hypothetical protein LZ554_008319 [Drepanopeziza brunnea f. sp. 'monogermtubi']